MYTWTNQGIRQTRLIFWEQLLKGEALADAGAGAARVEDRPRGCFKVIYIALFVLL